MPHGKFNIRSNTAIVKVILKITVPENLIGDVEWVAWPKA